MNAWPLWLLFFSLVCVVPPSTPSAKRLVLVVDCSGSMGDDCWNAAISNVRTVTQQPTDDMELVVYAFASRIARYPDSGVVRLPDAKALEQLDTWLHQVALGTETHVDDAMRLALREQGPRTVMLVTDGAFFGQHGDAALLEVVGKEPVVCIGVGAKQRDVLTRIGKNGGGYWHEGGVW